MLLKFVATVCALTLGHGRSTRRPGTTRSRRRAARGVLARLGRRSADQRLHRVGRRSGGRSATASTRPRQAHRYRRGGGPRRRRKGRRHDRGRRGRPDLDQRRELRLDEGRICCSARSWRTCRTSATSTPRASRPRSSTSRCRPTASGGALGHGPVRVLLRYRAVAQPPRSMPALLEWIKAHPGRFTYPAPPDFIGTFEARADRADRPARGAPAPRGPGRLRRGDRAALGLARRRVPISGARAQAIRCPARRSISCWTTARSTSPWRSIRPKRRRRSRAGRLPETVRTFILEDGTIGNTHFVAIPFNAAHTAGAMGRRLPDVARGTGALGPAVWGDGTVLDLDALAPEDRARFDALPLGVAMRPTR